MAPKKHCRRRLRVLIAAANGSTLRCAAFCPQQIHQSEQVTSLLRKQRSLHSTVLNNSVDSESNFWYTVSRKYDDAQDHQRPGFPVVPSLDADGPLPRNSYNLFGRQEYQPKPTCALAIAVDLKRSWEEDTTDVDAIVEGMQQFIDHGFTTFHLGLPQSSRPKRSGEERDCGDRWLPSSCQVWGESDVYGKLHKSTPPSVMKKCQLVVPLMTPPEEAEVSRLLVREAVTQSLTRSGTDAIDNLEVHYSKGSPYHMDMMDYLVDLQRDGLIRSVSGRGFPTTTMRALESCGFHLDSHQRGYNLLSPDTSMAEYQLAASDLGTPNILFNPLAGGLLTNKFEGLVFPPLPSELGSYQSKQIHKTLQSWARMRQQQQRQEGIGDTDVHYLLAWEQYQKLLLPQLQESARKYRVSVASVALRWVLQMEQTAGTIIGCDMVKDADNKGDCLSARINSLRDTLRFELDEEDLEFISQATTTQHKPSSQEGFEDLDVGSMMNPRLWL